MPLKESLDHFPPDSVFRQLLPKLVAQDGSAREEGYKQLRELDRLSSGENPITPNWRFSEKEALALLGSAFDLKFPPPRFEWNDVVHDMIFLLVRSPYESLLDLAQRNYPKVSHRAKCAILSLFAASGSRPGAESFMFCVSSHGWPNNTYDRVFTELPKLLSYSEVFFPGLIEIAGSNIGTVTNLFVAAVAQGKFDLKSAKVSVTATLVQNKLSDAIESVAPSQSRKGAAWRFSEEYWSKRHQTCALLDVAGYLTSGDFDRLLKKALSLSDPRILAFAAISMIRRGGELPKGVLHKITVCHETRHLFFQLLQGLNRLDLFPEEFRQWDAFAASNMVDWLMYPAELGREPDELELMAIFTAKKTDGELALYVWRFRNEGDPWYAGVSGPYLREGEPRPLHGDLTFSCFEQWETATAAEHAEASLKTLEEWQTATGG